MIYWILQKIKLLFNTNPSGMIEGVDYEVVDIDDSDIVEIRILRGVDAGEKIRVMREALDENRNTDSEESNV